MPDNVLITAGVGTSVATDQVGSDHYQLIKLAFGPLDTATLVTASVGLPISVAALPLPSGAATETSMANAAGRLVTIAAVDFATQTTLAAINAKLPALGQALAAASVPIVLTAAQITTLTPVAAITGFATETTLAALNTKVTACNTGAVVIAAGTAGIGKLTANAGVTIGAVEIAAAQTLATVTTVTTVSAVTAITNALPAGTNLLGRVASSLETSTLYNATTALTPKFFAISTAASGITQLVAAVSSKKIRVVSYHFKTDADVSVKFRDNTAGVDLTGAMASGAKGGGDGAAFSPVGHFETASGNALSINLSGAVQVSGHGAYIEV